MGNRKNKTVAQRARWTPGWLHLRLLLLSPRAFLGSHAFGGRVGFSEKGMRFSESPDGLVSFTLSQLLPFIPRSPLSLQRCR